MYDLNLPDNYVVCGKTGEKCATSYVGSKVYYGANGSYFTKDVNGSKTLYDCDNNEFGDPIENVEKACYRKLTPEQIQELAIKAETERLEKIRIALEQAAREAQVEKEKLDREQKERERVAKEELDKLEKERLEKIARDAKEARKAQSRSNTVQPAEERERIQKIEAELDVIYMDSLPPGYKECADHKDYCENVPVGSDVYYGTKNRYFAKTVKNSEQYCDQLEFGNPMKKESKKCYARVTESFDERTNRLKKLTDVVTPVDIVPPDNYIKCADEGGMCYDLPVGTGVYYGADKQKGHRMKTVNNKRDVFRCTQAAFGGIDPAPGKTKGCYANATANTVYNAYPSDYKDCAEEGGVCSNLPSRSEIYFGANGKYYKRNVHSVQDKFACNPENFGGSPINGPKACYAKVASSARTNK